MCDMIEISKGFTQNCHIYTLIPWPLLNLFSEPEPGNEATYTIEEQYPHVWMPTMYRTCAPSVPSTMI